MLPLSGGDAKQLGYWGQLCDPQGPTDTPNISEKPGVGSASWVCVSALLGTGLAAWTRPFTSQFQFPPLLKEEKHLALAQSSLSGQGC